jgi:hypothetical protein
MDTFELRFYIRGEAYCQVRYYRQEMDLRVIRSQIERIGKAIVIRLRDQEMLNQISELPKLGEATISSPASPAGTVTAWRSASMNSPSSPLRSATW